LVKAYALRTFNETVEIAVETGCDPRKSNQTIRGVVALPHGTGKQIRIAVFAKEAKADEAKASGADIVGGQDLADEILGGKIEFDRCFATPDMMGIVGKVARILGPRGLMPNPKMGSVTNNIKETVKAAKTGTVEFRSNKSGAVLCGFGKVSFPAEHIEENFKAFLQKLRDVKPDGVKIANYVRKITISSCMGPGIKVDLGQFRLDKET